MPGLRFSYIAPISMYVLREYRPMTPTLIELRQTAIQAVLEAEAAWVSARAKADAAYDATEAADDATFAATQLTDARDAALDALRGQS